MSKVKFKQLIADLPGECKVDFYVEPNAEFSDFLELAYQIKRVYDHMIHEALNPELRSESNDE